jgi:DNA-binding Lrp family transcriptional regulator
MLEKKQKEILHILRENPRISLSRIAKELNIDVREVYEKIKKLENSIITKYSPLLDFEKIGYPILVNYFIEAETKTENDILKGFLLNNIHVNNLYKTRGGYISELIFKDMKEFSDFNEMLDRFKLKKKRFHPVIKEIKREGFIL